MFEKSREEIKGDINHGAEKMSKTIQYYVEGGTTPSSQTQQERRTPWLKPFEVSNVWYITGLARRSGCDITW